MCRRIESDESIFWRESNRNYFGQIESLASTGHQHYVIVSASMLVQFTVCGSLCADDR